MSENAALESTTRWYAVTEDIRDRGLAAKACHAVLGVLQSRIARARIDAYTDFRKAITPEAAAAEEALMNLGKRQHRGDPGMGVQLDLSTTEHRDLLARYAPWSIDVDLYGADDVLVANFHDCAYSIGALLTPDEASDLAARLADELHLKPLDLDQQELARLARPEPAQSKPPRQWPWHRKSGPNEVH